MADAAGDYAFEYVITMRQTLSSEGSAGRASIIRLTGPAMAPALLIANAIAGRPEAASALWTQYAPLVRSILRRSLGPGHDVDDATQETFVRLFRRLPTLRAPEKLRSFLIGITLRVASSEIRARRVRRWLHLTPTGTPPEVEADAVDHASRQAVSRLYVILDGLKDVDRHCFVLRHLEQLELTEVADALDISLATVKRQLDRIELHVSRIAERDPLLREHFLATKGGTNVAAR